MRMSTFQTFIDQIRILSAYFKDGCRDSCLDLIGRSLENHSRIFPAQVEFKIPLSVKISVGNSLATMATVEQQI